MECILHKYTEQSARAKLSRHRHRGDVDAIARFHDECGSWHVLDGEGVARMREEMS